MRLPAAPRYDRDPAWSRIPVADGQGSNEAAGRGACVYECAEAALFTRRKSALLLNGVR